jgi:hypothetical protein
MAIDNKLLMILVCPVCKGSLDYDRNSNELICRTDRLAYPVQDDIPVMLPAEARSLESE